MANLLRRIFRPRSKTPEALGGGGPERMSGGSKAPDSKQEPTESQKWAAELSKEHLRAPYSEIDKKG